MTNLDDFLRGYAEAMLWANAVDAETGEQVEDMEYAYITPGEWWTDVPGLDLDDARDFYFSQCATMGSVNANYAQHGHDFALTRNHHGSGFWDRGYGPMGDTLTEAAHAYGDDYIFITSEDN
jgi:hypothetical protein